MNMQIKTTLYSEQDDSVNFVFTNGLECRYVNREGKLLVYVSSQTGCKQACRFCHLTQMGLTDDTNATIDEIYEQVHTVMNYADSLCENFTQINVNFMARGEPLKNPVVRSQELYDRLAERFSKYTIPLKFNISTIVPDSSVINELGNIKDHSINVFYSLYSTNATFRKRWLPKADDYTKTFVALEELYKQTNNVITVHFCFIEGENDSVTDVENIIKEIKKYDFEVKFNLVRYNPFSDAQGKESSDEVIKRNFEILQDAFPHERTRIVSRIGYDVQASCGMFFSDI